MRPDGIYLDLTFAEYLSEERMSSGDLTRLMEGPSSYWAESPMNPDRPEDEDTPAKLLGRAYHCARFEPDEFPKRYVKDFTPDEMDEGSLLSDRQYKDWLKEHGEPMAKSGETVLERAIRIEGMGGPSTWHVARHHWEIAIEDQGREILSEDQFLEIKRDAIRLRKNPEIASLIEDGFPEVSILWTDPETGIKCKCRPDWLAPTHALHLKTWDSKSFGKPSNRAIAENFQWSGHYRTAWFYRMGLNQIPTLSLRHPDGKKAATLAGEIFEHWHAGRCEDDWFLFQRRGGVPDIRARRVRWFDLPPGVPEQSTGTTTEKFRKVPTALARKAELEVRACFRLYLESCEIYGTKGEPWFPRDMIGDLEDADFSDWWLDSVEEPR